MRLRFRTLQDHVLSIESHGKKPAKSVFLHEFLIFQKIFSRRLAGGTQGVR
jgi:hypothetical protein